MLSVSEAQKILFDRMRAAAAVPVAVADAYGLVLAETIHSPVDLPLFDQSAMDGYAIASKDEKLMSFRIVGEIRAGMDATIKLEHGEAVRIFTGAPIPAGTDAIVIQEKVNAKDDLLQLTEPFRRNVHIRKRGTQIRKGGVAFEAGTQLNPGSAGLLASMGISSVHVHRKPAVSVITTGDEIVPAGTALRGGQIFESNSVMLGSALKGMHISPAATVSAPDRYEELKSTVTEVILRSDIILITGGISVGKYDLVHQLMQDLGVETVFYKVAQKPGKPLYAGILDGKWFFALPGNPASALVCFYEYAYPSIRMMMGIKNAQLPVRNAILQRGIAKKELRAEFVRGAMAGEEVVPLEGQDSGMLLSFAQANVLIYLPAEKQSAAVGDTVEVHVLPFPA